MSIFKQVMLDGATHLRLSELRKDLLLPSKAAVVRYLIAEHSKHLVARPAAFEEVFADSRPMIITGPSGSGKTTTCKALLSRLEGPCMVLDPSNEYADFEPVHYGGVAGVDWSKSVRIRVPLSADVGISQVEASLVFRQLALAMSQGSLKEWVLCVEEAHRFADDPELKSFTLEARKGTRKLLILTAQPGPFAELAPVFGPMPH